jgi:UDP-glucose 4-epimerase
MTTVLVTGGAGFIGSHLAEALLKKNYKVRVLDNLSSGHRAWVPAEAEFVEGDIRHLDDCRKAMQGIQGVFHLAAMSRVAPSLDNIDLATQSNIVGTQNILSAMRETGVKKIVYSGSSTYYGNQPIPHREFETAPEFLNFYSLSKHVGSEYCLLFDRLYDMHAIVLRYFNAYGPRQPQEGAYALVLGIFLQRWLKGETLIVHGDGSQRRDFVHVRDIARANIMAFESPLRSKIYNVGCGTNISIKELANMISPDQRHEGSRKGDSKETLADIRRITQDLGWNPEVAFTEGLNEMKQRMKAGLEKQ